MSNCTHEWGAVVSPYDGRECRLCGVWELTRPNSPKFLDYMPGYVRVDPNCYFCHKPTTRTRTFPYTYDDFAAHTEQLYVCENCDQAADEKIKADSTAEVFIASGPLNDDHGRGLVHWTIPGFTSQPFPGSASDGFQRVLGALELGKRTCGPWTLDNEALKRKVWRWTAVIT